jgi:hypothetical protein
MEKKVKVSDDKEAFATFYTDKENKNKWWVPTFTQEHPFIEAHLPLKSMLSRALVWLATSGCTPVEMWNVAGELAGTASSGIEGDNVVLIQECTLAVIQVKAPATEGRPQKKDTSGEL